MTREICSGDWHCGMNKFTLWLYGEGGLITGCLMCLLLFDIMKASLVILFANQLMQ